MYLVERTCTEVPESGSDDQMRIQSHPFSDYRHLSAYVLLGDPGTGKTTAFEQEAEQEEGCYISARDLITYDNRPEWRGKTLFIDGLDEIRAGSADARTPFDRIRARLDKLGRPRFRLSCREADWFGTTDQEHLKSVSSNGKVTILHLDPLTEADIAEILNHNSRIPNSKSFIQKAEQRGLTGLLTNPQILDMLTKAVAGGSWPESRQQTFELACQTIIREHNREHIAATTTNPTDAKQLLNAAGFLCAVQLITGNAGYALSANMANLEFPELNNSVFDNTGLLREVVRTKLFKAPVDGRVTPIHRHVAEYLAATYLAERIEQAGLPIARVVALITGEDGVVVAELRGLSAWLATLCMTQRNTIIERDPLGIVLYGDVQNFTRQGKRCVLDNLQREATRYPWFRLSNWATSPFGALSTPDMEEEFREVLTPSDRNEAHQALAECVLDAMAHGTRLVSLDDVLQAIVRDSSWGSRIRRKALEVFWRNGADNTANGDRLKTLLDEINSGLIDDSDDELMGYLLVKLYPEVLPAGKLLDYLHIPKRRNLIGSYLMFWYHRLPNECSDLDVRALLDGLAIRKNILQPILNNYHLRKFATGILARGVEIFGESIAPERLYNWLGVGLDKYGSPSPRANSESHITRIRIWLEAHTNIQKSIIKTGLDRCFGEKDFRYCIYKYKARNRLFQAAPPSDYGLWCLQQIQTTTNEDVTEFLLQEAVSAVTLQRGDTGISLEAIENFSRQDERYQTMLSSMLFCHIYVAKPEHLAEQQQRIDEEQKKEAEWQCFARSHETEIREGGAPPQLLHDLATAYFGYFIESEGDTPIERLRNFLNHDEGLVQATIEGLRNTLQRSNIPSVKDIIRLNTKGRTYLLSRPFLAGLLELTRGSQECILQLNDGQIKKAVAFYLVDNTGEDPGWYTFLLTTRPNLVAEVLVRYAIIALRSNKQSITELYGLAYIESYSQVAPLTVLPLLKSFPVRCTSQQHNSLNDLLKAGLRYVPRADLLALTETKLHLRSMSAAQRVRWLATALIIAPDKYLEPLADFTRSQKRRVQHLADFLADRHNRWSPLDDLPASALGLLACLIGEFFAPYEMEGGGLVSPAMNAADFVSRLINLLGSNPGKDTTDMLEELLRNNKLHGWHSSLRHAKFQQAAARREASFRHPDIRQVSKMLNNRSPANAGDLAALTVDILLELAHRIRNGNTDDYRQYWNEESRRQPTVPKHEDACRDTLLSDLQQRLEPFGIDAQPEGHYADDKRADIRVAFGGANGFEVPIEIKKNTHKKLWYAMHEQLIRQYTRDPRADGFGIYLVFWFGPENTQSPPSGSRPLTASELEDRLRAMLSDDENRKISVCVIDVAKPE